MKLEREHEGEEGDKRGKEEVKNGERSWGNQLKQSFYESIVMK